MKTLIYNRRVLSMRRHIFLQLAELDPMIGTVAGAVVLSLLALAIIGGVR